MGDPVLIYNICLILNTGSPILTKYTMYTVAIHCSCVLVGQTAPFHDKLFSATKTTQFSKLLTTFVDRATYKRCFSYVPCMHGRCAMT